MHKAKPKRLKGCNKEKAKSTVVLKKAESTMALKGRCVVYTSPLTIHKNGIC